MRIVRAADLPFVPASHEDPQRPGVLKRVIATREQMLPGHCQMINWAQLPVGSSFRTHYHEDMEETFIIVRGHAQMTIDDARLTLAPGDAAIVAPREVHQMTNAGDETVEYIVVGVSLGRNGRTIVVGP